MRRMRHIKAREIQGCQLALDAAIASSLYDATSGGSLVGADGSVARWEDQSGNGRHVTQETSANRPLYRTAGKNGRATLQANATACTLNHSSYYPSTSNADFTGIVISEPNTSNQYSCAFEYGQNSAGNRISLFSRYDTSKSAIDFGSSYIGRQGSPAETSGWSAMAVYSASSSKIGDVRLMINTTTPTIDYKLSENTTLNIGTALPLRLFNNAALNSPIKQISFFAFYDRSIGLSVLARIQASKQRIYGIKS